eukprot:scpid110866/ scgid6714/ 
MKCCTCNKHGSCKRCICSTEGRECSNCQPGSFGRCSNQIALRVAASQPELTNTSKPTTSHQLPIPSSSIVQIDVQPPLRQSNRHLSVPYCRQVLVRSRYK